MSVSLRHLALSILLLSCGVAGPTYAQNSNTWNGIYGGFNAGAVHGTLCNQWTPAGGGIDTANAAALADSDCLSSGVVGGLQIGDNFQYGHVFWGLAADLDIWHSSNQSSTVAYSGSALPAGNYRFSNRVAPKGFAIVGPRIGYAGSQWMPYVRMGAMLPFGGRESSLYYTPVGATASTAAFDGGKGFSSTGWVAGAGMDWGLKGAWSMSAEYLHASFGKASGTVAGCAGAAARCAEFSGITFQDAHDASRANIFRIGVSYWFDFWDIGSP